MKPLAIVPSWEKGKITGFSIHVLADAPKGSGYSYCLGPKLKSTSNFTAAEAFVSGYAAAQGELEL